MTNPFAPLSPALRALAAEGRVLPATGQAITDLVSPDLEEAYDRATGGRDETITAVWETPNRRLYHPLTPCYRAADHRYRYFVDGSARCYFIGTLLEHQRSSPVQLAQVGAAAVRRDGRGQMHRAGVHHKILLLLDKNALSDELWAATRAALAGAPGFELRSSSSQSDRFSNALGITEPRARGAHRANWAMREMEVSLARDDLRDHESWLIMDGSLGNEYMDWQGAPLIGVAKSFRRDSLFSLGTGPRATQMNLYSLLAGLEVNQRTAVFPCWPGEDREGKIVFWYVRIRPQTGLDYPLMGVVKVEMPNPDREPVDNELADALSNCLAAERCVTPHGRDSRWHAHLYPISIAERVIQDRFHSEQVMKAAIRWPELGIHFGEKPR